MRPAPSDTVPAMLTPGEAVLNKEAAELVGRDKIKQINKMGMHMRKAQGYADGDPNVQPATSSATSRLAGMKGYSASGSAERVANPVTANDYMQREAKPIAATTPMDASYRDRAVAQGLMADTTPALEPVVTQPVGMRLGQPQLMQPQVDLLGEYRNAVGLANGTEMVPKTDTWVDRVKNFGTQLYNNGFAGAMNAATENWEGALGLNKPMSDPNKPDVAPKMQPSGMRFVPTKPTPVQPVVQTPIVQPGMPKDVGGRLATDMDSLMQQKYQGIKAPAQQPQPAAPAPQAEEQLTGNRVIPAGMRLTSYGAVTPINNPLAYEAERRMAERAQVAQMAPINASIQQAMNPSADDGTFTGMGRAKRQASGARAALSELTGMQKAQMGAEAASADRAANREVTMRGQDLANERELTQIGAQGMKDQAAHELQAKNFELQTLRFMAERGDKAAEQKIADEARQRGVTTAELLAQMYEDEHTSAIFGGPNAQQQRKAAYIRNQGPLFINKNMAEIPIG